MNNIYNFLGSPPINIAIFIAILIPLIFSLTKYKKEKKKEDKHISIGFFLLLLARISQNIGFYILQIKPKTSAGVLFSIIVVSLVFIAAVLIFYNVRSLKNRKT